jgi:hypothetical protein
MVVPMTTRIRRFTALATSVALVGGAGFGVAQAASGTSTATSATAAKQGKGPGHGPRLDAAALATALGVTEAQLKTALDAVKPATGDRKDGREGLAADLAKALGVDTAKVQEILDANRPARPAAGTKRADGARPPKGGKPGRPDQTALVAALAKGLGLEQSAVTAAFAKLDAAHEADHAARDAAFAAALAKQLGLTDEAVTAALDKVRPAKPAAPPATP